MTLRTVAIPAPPAGQDFFTVVPGQYLYDVTGITATLNTGGGPPTVLVDASGNGFDGTYTGVPLSVPGLVPGDAATDWSGPPSATAHVPFGVIDWTADWTVEWWAQGVQGAQASALYVVNGTDPTYTTQLTVDVNALGVVTVQQVTSAVTVDSWGTAFFAVPTPGDPHYIVATYTAGTGAIAVYVDGAAVPTFDAGPGPFSLAGLTDIYLPAPPSAGNFAGPTVEDELAIYGAALSAGQVATHYAAGLVDIATYETAVLADAPAAYYHLDDASAGGPRQVALFVATSTGLVELIPTGFAEIDPGGPAMYSWQPNLPASSQTPSGSLTTVAIPRLLLPAGYTVGSDTLDIGVDDQWSDITLWWDDTAMLMGVDLNPYEYPPGVTLVYTPPGVP